MVSRAVRIHREVTRSDTGELRKPRDDVAFDVSIREELGGIPFRDTRDNCVEVGRRRTLALCLPTLGGRRLSASSSLRHSTIVLFAVNSPLFSSGATTRKTTSQADAPVPAWITLTQLVFMAFTVMVAHYPPLFIGGFLFFLAGLP